MVLVANFDPNLNQLSGQLLEDLDYGTPRRIKRIKGSEIILVGCDRHFAILEYKNGSLIQIGTLKDIHDGAVTDFVVRGRYMYSKAYGEQEIKITEFDANTTLVRPSSTIVESSTNIRPEPIASNRSLANSTHPRAQKYQPVTKGRIPVGAGKVLEKVSVSKDGRKIYTGGQGLNILERAGTEFKPVTHSLTSKKFV